MGSILKLIPRITINAMINFKIDESVDSAPSSFSSSSSSSVSLSFPSCSYCLMLRLSGALPSPRPVGDITLSGSGAVGDLEEAGAAEMGEKRTRRPNSEI